MTLDSIFTLSLAIFLFITLVILTIFFSKRFGEEEAVPFFFFWVYLISTYMERYYFYCF